MRIKITESQLKNLSEVIKKNNKVECDQCGHTWDLSDAGKDPYTCHMCWNNNEPKKDETAKWIKCRSCGKRFTQTIYKNKKSIPYCSHCGTLNN